MRRVGLSTDNIDNRTTHSKNTGRRDNISSAAYHSPTIIINNNVSNVRGSYNMIGPEKKH